MTIEQLATKFLEEEQLANGQLYKIVPNQLFDKFFEWMKAQKIHVKTEQVK